MELNATVLDQLLSAYREDSDVLDLYRDALASFEAYHEAIFNLEIQRKAYAMGAMTAEEYREKIPALDKTRTRAHNTVLANLKILNRLAESAGLAPVYDGVVSEERPYRREAANAVLAYIATVIDNRA